MRRQQSLSRRGVQYNCLPDYGPRGERDEDGKDKSGESNDNDLRTDADVLRVYDSLFCFAATERYSDAEIESTIFYFDSFFTDVAAGRRFFASSGCDDDDLREDFIEDREYEPA